MSAKYAEDKIRLALKMYDGDVMRARHQIMSWANEDAALLRAIIEPHLDGIVAYWVERVASGRSELEKRQPKNAPPRKNKKNDNFGMDLLRAVAASGAEIFGHENTKGGAKHSLASKQHIEAIHKMAASRYSAKKNPDKKA